MIAQLQLAGQRPPGQRHRLGTMDESRACFLEITEPLQLPNGENRRYLEDGDEVVFRARAERDGYVAIGFGECRGRIVGAGE